MAEGLVFYDPIVGLSTRSCIVSTPQYTAPLMRLNVLLFYDPIRVCVAV